MRRRAPFPFRAPARVTAEPIVGIVVATEEGVSADLKTLDLSTRVIAGYLRILGLEIVPVEKPRRRWWRPNKNRGGSP